MGFSVTFSVALFSVARFSTARFSTARFSTFFSARVSAYFPMAWIGGHTTGGGRVGSYGHGFTGKIVIFKKKLGRRRG